MSIQNKFVPIFLKIISRHPDGVTTREVMRIIEMTYPFSEEDLEILPSTGKPRWEQIVRNLNSNKVMQINDLAYIEDKKWNITNVGLKYLEYE